jgi:SAM-dependent methyltransferase
MTECERLTESLLSLDKIEKYYQWIGEEAHPFLGDRLAEIGAGIGTFTNVLVRGHVSRCPTVRLAVFEPERTLFRLLQERMEHRYPELLRAGRVVATNGYFHAPPEQFDTVVMINVLEHIEDDQDAIRAAYHALAPGGACIVFVPALSWLYSALDRSVGHYRRYERTQLEQIMRAGGFEVVAAKYMDCLGVLPWYLLNVIGGSTSINPRLARLYDRWFVPVTRWIEQFGPPRIGKNILIVARKNAPNAP